MNVSVIIPTYNASMHLPALIQALQKQTISHELVIIDSSSTDGTAEIAKSAADIFYTIPKHLFDHGEKRSRAAKLASCDYLVFFTQDALPANDRTLEKLLAAFQEPTIAAAYGRQLPHAYTSLFGKHLRYFNYPDRSHIRYHKDKKTYGLKTAFLSNSFAAYKKNTLKELDWFKPGLILGEDMYMAAKILEAGYGVAYVSDAEVYHAHSYTIFEEFQRYFDIGVFHRTEPWLLKTFGKPEGEGKRFILSEIDYLIRQHAYSKLPAFVARNGMKYLGYSLGKHYDKLPKKLISTFSMHSSWWHQHEHY